MILASTSPRRKEILTKIGFNLEIKTKEVEEVSNKVDIYEKIEEIALKKAIGIALENPKEYVVSADTVIGLDGEIIGKANSENEAKKILKKLSGREHLVITAYSLINIEKNIKIVTHSVSKVFFKKLSNELIEWYLSTGEYTDKAGAYAIQGKGAIFVEKIEGDFLTIVGFPLSDFIDKLEKIGININDIDKI